MAKQRVLFAASEVYPFAKSGGLADVAYSLPRALAKAYDVSVVMPLYRFIDRERFGITSLQESFNITMGGVGYPVTLYGCDYDGIRYCFISSPLLSDREFLYGPPERGYDDNAIRFGIFNYAIAELLRRETYQIAHLNDWQCGLLPLLLEEHNDILTQSVYMIHNLAYQGVFDKSFLYSLGIDEKFYTIDSLEFYGQINFMKAGIAYADRMTTVSPTYAAEILTAEFGCGLEGFLSHHRSKLTGIVNGIDTDHFSPSNDKALVKPYDDLKGKAVNKRDYLKAVGLTNAKKPLFIFIGRFTWQKGLDLLIETLPKIAMQECNIAILGEGEVKYHTALQTIVEKHQNIHLEFGYDESVSHRMYAAADFLLMPSLFEPCGLNQMITMHYGAMPVVHRVGGLLDTVESETDFKSGSPEGFGIVLTEPTMPALDDAVSHAVDLYGNKRRYNRICRHNMRCDFSWKESAERYATLYRMLTS